MSFTAADVINHARDMHPALSKTNAPNSLAYRYLSRKNRELIRQIVRRVPANEALLLVVAFPLANFQAGVDLTAQIPGGTMDLLEGVFRYANTSSNPQVTVRAPFIPWEQKDMAQPLPSFTYRNNVLYFIGDENYYQNFSEFRLTYTPLPVDITGPADTFNLPDDARECLASGLAGFWLKRLVGQPALGVDGATATLFLNDAAEDEKRFLSRVWNLAARQNYRVSDVQGAGGAGGAW